MCDCVNARVYIYILWTEMKDKVGGEMRGETRRQIER